MAQHPPTQEENDKLVQGAADKDNYHTDYARTVEPSMMATITWENHHIVSIKYPKWLS